MKAIFTYEKYQNYLRDWIANQPRRGRGILKNWSDALRIEPSVLSQILGGRRELTLDQAYELQLQLGLSDLESDYFSTLVLVSRAATEKLRRHLKSRLEKLKIDSLILAKRLSNESTLSDEEKSIFYSSWLYSALRLATSLEKFQTPEDLAARFNVDRERILTLMKFLIQAGLVAEENGRYRSGAKQTHLEKTSPYIVKHHANWRTKALVRADDLADEELMFTGTLSISRADFMRVREDIVALIGRLRATIKDTTPEELAVFQVDLMWIK